MSPAALFRTLILASVILGIASIFVAFSPGEMPEPWQQALELNGDGGYMDVFDDDGDDEMTPRAIAVIAGFVVLLLVLIALWIGLFLFWRPARMGNVIVSVLYVASIPWGGLTVYLPLEEMLSEAMTMIEGAIIALSYSPPIKHLFERHRGAPPPLPVA